VPPAVDPVRVPRDPVRRRLGPGSQGGHEPLRSGKSAPLAPHGSSRGAGPAFRRRDRSGPPGRGGSDARTSRPWPPNAGEPGCVRGRSCRRGRALSAGQVVERHHVEQAVARVRLGRDLHPAPKSARWPRPR
jgi:hypothetical protein